MGHSNGSRLALLLLGASVLCMLLFDAVQSLPVPHVRVFDPLKSALWKTPSENDNPTAPPTITLVESLPVGDFALTSVLPQTFDALHERTIKASKSIDLSAMYWCVYMLFDWLHMSNILT